VNGCAHILLLVAFGSCVFLLGFLLVRYVNLPVDKNYKTLLKEDGGEGF
jgi:hypothetical protein